MNDFFAHPEPLRSRLLHLYRAGLAAVAGQRCVAEHLRNHPQPGPVRVVAIGKAAEAMLAGARQALGDGIEAALLITKHGSVPATVPAGTEVIAAGHPVPDAASLCAGERLLRFLAADPAPGQWLFLISGGASSLVEVPVAGIDLADLQRLNRWLLASGLPITRVNALRRRFSRIKGGQLCAYLAGRPARVLLISDVPGDDPASIGSGLLFASQEAPDTAEDDLPDWLRALLARAVEPAAQTPHPAAAVRAEIVANLDRALAAVAMAATAAGLPVYRAPGRLDGDAETTGMTLARSVLQGPAGVYLWGGETTVTLPDSPGQGGRCQQLALATAVELAGHAGIAMLAAGTDGNDGPGEAAGACVDGQTIARGAAKGLDARAALLRADAGTFLAASGDLLDTGPTGTNVTDLVIALKAAG